MKSLSCFGFFFCQKPEILGRDQEQDAYYLLTSRPKQLTLSKKIYEFYNAPITKFWMYVMSYSIVLVLFTYVVLVRKRNLKDRK